MNILEKTFDVLWSVEFLEHMGRQYMRNYFPMLRRAALICVTASTSGGWHHVEARQDWWWRARFTAQGFIYSKGKSNQLKSCEVSNEDGCI